MQENTTLNQKCEVVEQTDWYIPISKWPVYKIGNELELLACSVSSNYKKNISHDHYSFYFLSLKHLSDVVDEKGFSILLQTVRKEARLSSVSSQILSKPSIHLPALSLTATYLDRILHEITFPDIDG